MKKDTHGKLHKALRVTIFMIMIIVGLMVVVLLVMAIYQRITTGSWLEVMGVAPYTDSNQEFYRGKTFWDLLELMIIPAILAVGLFWLNQSARRVELEIAGKRDEAQRERDDERDHEAALQAYLDKMTELILKQELSTSRSEDPVRDVARSRTLTVLRVIDGTRRGLILRFLYEAGLINKTNTVVNLRGADLSGAALYRANLYNANLDEVILDGADLREAVLEAATMSRASLEKADLRKASLRWASLREACMRGTILEQAVLIAANLDLANLEEAKLAGASMNRAVFSDANLRNADLSGANLNETSLFGANLSGAKLRNSEINTTNFYWVDLTNAELKGTVVSDSQLAQARSLERTKMPDGSTHS